MKKLWILLLLPVMAQAGAVYEDRNALAEAVRQQIGIESTTQLPDTTLDDIVAAAVVWTSTDIGGVEAQYKIATVDEQGFYAVADSIVKVLYASIVTKGGKVYSLKSWPPQHHNDLGGEPELSGGESDPLPQSYNIWADTLQVSPPPINDDDTLVLKCFVEHRALAVDSSDIQLRPAYTEAAKFYACMLALLSIENEKSAIYEGLYEKRKADLINSYTREFDLLK
jgi:hypothetical protein